MSSSGGAGYLASIVTAVGTGVGTTQRDILTELSHTPDPAMRMMYLAGLLDRDERQIRRAVRALENRGLVVVIKTYGWHPVHGGRQRCREVWELWVFLPESYAEWSAA